MVKPPHHAEQTDNRHADRFTSSLKMPFFTGVANSLSIYKNLHTMVAARVGIFDFVPEKIAS